MFNITPLIATGHENLNLNQYIHVYKGIMLTFETYQTFLHHINTMLKGLVNRIETKK